MFKPRKDRMYSLDVWQRKPKVNAAEWAEQNRYMQSTRSMFSYLMTPYFREPSTYMSDLAGTHRIVLKTPAQVGKTCSIETLLGWMCEYDRANTLLVFDSLKTGQRMSKNRLRPFLRDTCGVNSKEDANPDKSKEVCNIGLGSGANLIIGSASSASDLCSTPVKYLFCDELDRWVDVLDKEGDPLSLAFQRQMRFRGMALLTSTPTVEEGRINTQFKLGTMETWSAVCPCGCFMPCRYDDIDFSGDIPTYACPQCGTVYCQKEIEGLPHRYSPPANANPVSDRYGRICRSYEVYGPLCHAFYTWEDLKEAEREARAVGEESVRSFRNTRLGEIYVPPSEIVIRVPDLMRGMAHYSIRCIPSAIKIIVMGIDTHDDGFPFEVVGFDKDGNQYGLGWHWISGYLKTRDPWRQLSHFRKSTRFKTEDGRMLGITAACIDSGGHFTQDVYAFCARNKPFLPVKGYTSKTGEATSFIRGSTMQTISSIGNGTGRVALYGIGVTPGKDILMTKLMRCLQGDRVCVWTDDDEAAYTPTYFDELTSEKRIETRYGTRWELMPGRRNEALDCRVYAMACFEILQGRRLEVASLLRPVKGEEITSLNIAPKEHSGSVVCQGSSENLEILSQPNNMPQQQQTSNVGKAPEKKSSQEVKKPKIRWQKAV